MNMLEEFLLIKEESLKLQAAIAYSALIFKANNPEILIDSLPKLLKDF